MTNVALKHPQLRWGYRHSYSIPKLPLNVISINGFVFLTTSEKEGNHGLALARRTHHLFPRYTCSLASLSVFHEETLNYWHQLKLGLNDYQFLSKDNRWWHKACKPIWDKVESWKDLFSNFMNINNPRQSKSFLVVKSSWVMTWYYEVIRVMLKETEDCYFRYKLVYWILPII